jgi:hypothetical protein
MHRLLQSLLSQIRQLAMPTDSVAFDAIAFSTDRLSGNEAALWKQLKC